LQTKEGLSLWHVIENTKICGILSVAVGKRFDPLNGHHIPCNLVAHSMLTFPIPWDPRFFSHAFVVWDWVCQFEKGYCLPPT